MTDEMIRIAITDDHQLVRKGLVTILNQQDDFLVVQEASNGRELLDGLAESRPGVVLLDLEMPVLDGPGTLDVLREKYPHLKVLILTMHRNDSFVVHLMEKGAHGYLLKDSDPNEVKAAIRQVMTQGFYFNFEVSKAMLGGLQTPEENKGLPGSAHNLNEREVELLRLICQQLTTTEIADQMFLSPKTIEGYRKALMEKTDSRNLAGLVLYAVKVGLYVP